MGSRLASLVPWLIAEVALVFLESRIWPDGGLWLLVLWNPVLMLYRFVVGQTPLRRNRLTVDLVFAIFCFLAAFEGGWYLLPAIVAWVTLDAAAVPVVRPLGRGDPEERSAAVAFVLGVLGIGAFLSGPLYATATSTMLADGSTATTYSAPGPLVAGLSPAALLVLSLALGLFCLAWFLASLDVRHRSQGAYRGLAVATAFLAALAILGTYVVGLFLVPGVAFSVVALWNARSARFVSAPG